MSKIYFAWALVLLTTLVNTEERKSSCEYSELKDCVDNCFKKVVDNNVLEKNKCNVDVGVVKHELIDTVHDGHKSKYSKRRSKAKIVDTEKKDIDITKLDAYEYPKLTRIEAGAVGEKIEVDLEDGQRHTRETKALRPKLFEIPGFLSSEECNLIISTAKNVGMGVSTLRGGNLTKQLMQISDMKNMADVTRLSQTAWLQEHHLGEKVMLKLRQRLSRLTNVPIEVLERSEPVQVVNYNPGGHYHAHLDSDQPNREQPCCIQAFKRTNNSSSVKCRLCRYITLMIYLNDVEEGGETAFPFADMDEETIKIKKKEVKDVKNLSRSCHKASLLVTPQKGKAVMWYNHDSDEKGYLGKTFAQANHGGCDVIKGSKWIANFWISWPTYENRFLKSIHLEKKS